MQTDPHVIVRLRLQPPDSGLSSLLRAGHQEGSSCTDGTNCSKKLSFSKTKHWERGSYFLSSVISFNLVLPVTWYWHRKPSMKKVFGDAIMKSWDIHDSGNELLPSQWAKYSSMVFVDISLNLGRSVFSGVEQRWSQNVTGFMSFCSKNISSLTPGPSLSYRAPFLTSLKFLQQLQVDEKFLYSRINFLSNYLEIFHFIQT